MADNVENATFDILKSIQAAIPETNARLERLEAGLRKDRRNSAGMLVMMRATAGDFDERVSELEEHMERIENRAG